ncbi:hypothetical protein ZWY2020_023726 [Hordeum vulgare]|nr:hypothetical protein ZWY2020_023726 [Hordeum vulgare]
MTSGTSWHPRRVQAASTPVSSLSSKDMWGLNSSHVLESHGELLRVSILVMYLKTGSSMKRVVTVLVHALEEETGTDGRQMVRWARRDGLSFADRVMFLGFPSSFAVDAARFHGVDYDVIGGCVYFLGGVPTSRRSPCSGTTSSTAKPS